MFTRRGHRQPGGRVHRAAAPQPGLQPWRAARWHQVPDPRPRTGLHRLIRAVFQAAGTRILRTAVQALHMNAICERLAGTLRREPLDRVLILGKRHLRAVLAEYQAHYTARPHRGIAQHIPGDPPNRSPRHSDRRRPTTDPPETCPGRPNQRVHARRLTTEDLQVTSTILFSSGRDRASCLTSPWISSGTSGRPVVSG